MPQAVTNGAAVKGVLSSEEHLHLTFQLPLRNEDDLKAMIGRIYDPTSKDFHKYLTVEQFTEKYAPAEADYQSVINFVQASGMKVVNTPRNRMLVEADGTAGQVNKALHVTMTTYQHPTENRTFFAPDREPTFNMGATLQHIGGLNSVSPPKAKLQLKTAQQIGTGALQPNDASSVYPPTPTGSGPYGSYIPPDFRAAYYGNGPLTGKGQGIGLVEFNGYDQVDLDNFYANTGWQPTTPINIVLLGGLTAPLGDGGNDSEPVLDIMYGLSLTPNLDQVRVYECCSANYNGSDSGQVVILNSMASENAVKQISSSWGWYSDRAAEDPIYEEMAAQGQTFFAAAGDYGSPINPGNNTNDDFHPADEPWVTAVSISLLTTNGPGGSWANDIYAGGAGGGYSDGPEPEPLPTYQVGIATAANQASTLFRNLPDVVIDGFGSYLCGGSDATSHGCYPNVNCQTCTNGGSSMSSPIWASLMALVNEQAALNGQPPIGFLNPALYSLAESNRYSSDFHDIIGGSNNCCGQAYSYIAVPGYDLVSGWGSPNGANLINDLVNQGPQFTLFAADGSISIGPSDSASTTISVADSSGFNGSVQLSVSGLPAGVTATFNNSSITSSAVLTLTSSSAPAVGTSVVTVTGTSGSSTATATFSLTITATQGNFTVGSSLTALSMQAGTSNTANSNNPNIVTVTSLDHFTSPVTLSMTGLPAGVTASFSPAVLTPSDGATVTSVLTINSATSTPTGNFTAAIVGTSGVLVQTTPFLFSSTSSYVVATTSSNFPVAQGASATVPVYVTSSNGFSSPVTLTVSGLPNGVTATFSPATITPVANGNANSNLTFTASSTAALAQTPVTISASFGQQVATEAATVTVTTPPPTFAITSPEAFSLNVGQNGWVAIPIAVQSASATYSQPVTLSISGLPTGITAQFSPSTVVPGDSGGTAYSTLTVTGGATAQLGVFNLATITGTAGAVTSTLQLYAGATGTLSVVSNVVATGGNAVFNYSVTQDLLNTSNTLAIFPHGVAPQTPNPLLQGNAGSLSGSVTLNTTNLSSGSYDAWILFQGGQNVLAGPVTFTVGAAPSFTVAGTPEIVYVTASSQASVGLTIASVNGFTNPVALTVSGLPAGVSGTFTSSTVTPTANGSVAAVLTLSKTLTAQSTWMSHSGISLGLLGAPFLLLFAYRRRKAEVVLALLVSTFVLMAGGCGTNNLAPVTNTYTVTVTGTSGATTASSTVTVNVQ